jgi:hypothetical protein
MSESKKLYLLWTNADPITSEKMVMMYGINSKLNYWWDEVTIIIWGEPLTEILKGNEKLLTV